MWKSAGRAPSLRIFTLAFALELKEKPRVRVCLNCALNFTNVLVIKIRGGGGLGY
jgi:hypothetical protein